MGFSYGKDAEGNPEDKKVEKREWQMKCCL